MKKIVLVLLVAFGLSLSPPVTQAEFRFADLWKRWVEVQRLLFRVESPLYTPVETSLSPSSAETKDSYTTEQRDVILTPAASSTTTPSTTSLSTTNATTATQSTLSARAFSTAIRPRESVHTITTDPIKIFTLGVKNTTQKSSTRFYEALLLDSATFRLFSNSGITEDVRDLELDIAGSTANFNADGTVTVRFQNARISSGDSVNFDVSIRIKDPNTTPHVPGTLRLRLENMQAVTEQSQKKVNVSLLGTPTSYQIVFDPISKITGSDSAASGNTYLYISSDTLEAGEERYVLSANFSAYYDDLSIREITLRNTLTGADIDPFVDQVKAINLNTNEIIGTGRFINGEARLFLSPRVFVGRSKQVRVGFKVVVADPISATSLDARFKLDVSASDVVVESLTTGRPLPDTNKSFSIDSATFAIAQSRMNIASSSQQYPFAVDTSRPETVFRFRIQAGQSDMALGRVSFDLYPSGLTFDGGSLDAGDVALVRYFGTYERPESVNISASGNKIMLDFPTEFYVYRNDVIEFGLQVQLDNLPGDSDSDLVSVRILGDSNHQKDTLAAVRATGANLVWSDLSARLHSVSTQDWFSGYLVSGIPSSSVIVKRFGN